MFYEMQKNWFASSKQGLTLFLSFLSKQMVPLNPVYPTSASISALTADPVK